MQVAVVHEDPVLETAVDVVDTKVAKENATIQHLGLLKNRTPLKPTNLHNLGPKTRNPIQPFAPAPDFDAIKSSQVIEVMASPWLKARLSTNDLLYIVHISTYAQYTCMRINICSSICVCA
jgi:hypothetical protein